ncbi:hypothetical protein [Flavobacterium alkalisoli]|uniref:hypothetical protein n=1 Tax=Flavobacterium alkalisoli TaxID=2602769 RepID=UPI003A8FDF60
MKKIAVLLALLLLAGCQKEEKKPEADFDMFVFSFATDATNFSIKFTPGDSIFMKTSPIDYFYSVLTEEKRDSALALVKEINFSKYDAVYKDSAADGSILKFYRTKNDTVNHILIQGNNGPKELYQTANKIIELQKGQRWTPITGKQDFGNIDDIKLPKPLNPIN